MQLHPESEKMMRHEICKLDDVPAEGAKVFPFFGREVQVWRVGEKVRVAANVCLHFGGPLECRDGRLVCPWHGAAYDMVTGAKEEGPGPAGARLMFLSTQVKDGGVWYVWGE
jgi:nitrite reductase/ring-hydroxylating ferredoxin subunit